MAAAADGGDDGRNPFMDDLLTRAGLMEGRADAEGIDSMDFAARWERDRATLWDDLNGFVAAVEWTEPWIIGLLLFHVVIFVAVVAWRKRFGAQMVFFVSLSAMVALAEPLNDLLAAHWKEFATQDYFDRRGVFISAVYSAPLAFILFVQLILTVATASQLLIEVKRLELEQKKKKEKESEASGGSGNDSGAAQGGARKRRRGKRERHGK